MENIIVALDGITKNKAIKIAQKLKDRVWGFKVNDLIYQDVAIITELKKYGRVFVDVKLYDIPNTVSNTVSRLNKLGADIITVHASGGIEMMKAAKSSSRQSKIIAVTVLTSKKIKSQKEILDLIKDSIEAKVDGVVVSGHELDSIKRITEAQKLLKIIPGIRPEWYKVKDDQKRIMTPKLALEMGADLLVIGRPITDSKNFSKALDLIIEECK